MRTVICALWMLCVLSCSQDRPESEPHADPGPGPVVDVVKRKTTDGDLALRNLSAQITAIENQLARGPRTLELVRMAVGLYLSRTQYLGSYEDFARADALTSEATREHPESYEGWLARADFLSAVHRFREALATLRQAEELGAPSQDDQRATYWLATGAQSARVFAIRNGDAERAETFGTLTALAAVLAARGEFAQADALYVRALAHYRDVSPLPIAWVSFQRGVMWAEMAGNGTWAKPLYEEAVRKVPGYVVANIHLAELEHAEGKNERATARLERVLSISKDPEVPGRLASWLESASARVSYREQATRGYQSLLAQYEPAFRDHAAEFYMGAGGDPALAVKLALANLAERDVPRAHLIALQALAAAGDGTRGCEVAQRAERFAWHVNLQNAVRELAGQCD